MRSIREIYVVGNGPSSSHTIGPSSAVKYILDKYQNFSYCKVTLYGSLAFTGKGHLTDTIISNILNEHNIKHEIIFDYKNNLEKPNMMNFEITLNNNEIKNEVIYSIGGGSIQVEGEPVLKQKEIYPHSHMKEIEDFCQSHQISLFDYVYHYEGHDIFDYCQNILKVMDDATKRGLEAEGLLPGTLKVSRKAKSMLENMEFSSLGKDDVSMNVAINSFAVAEENAAGGIVSTAPTCGSAGVIPGVIKYLRMKNVSEPSIIQGLCVAGLFGMVCKTNASVSGAQGGCQAEIGVASSMAAAMIGYCFRRDTKTIISAAEIALEHSLGLTCDPVDGYVQIPCIERCAVFAMKAINAFKFATIIPNQTSKVSYDDSIKTMYQTGKDMNIKYRETAEGGLASTLKKK